MTMSRAGAAMSVLVFLTSVPAYAQFRPERPYRGIFASGTDNASQTLTAQGTLSGGYDDNILADAFRGTDVRNQQSGGMGQLSGGLSYGLGGGRASFNAGAGGSVSYYPSLQNNYYKAYSANAGGRVTLLRRPELSANASVSYRPYTFLLSEAEAIEPGLSGAVAPELDFVPVESQYVNYQGGLNLGQRLSQRTRLSFGYSYSLADHIDRTFWRQGGQSSLSVQVSRGLAVRLGYGYSEGHYNDGRVYRSHRPDVGLDFLRALSLTRRTSLSFSVGTDATATADRTRIRATGSARVLHELGRSWALSGAYTRGTYYTESLSAPVFGDSAVVSLNGLISRRLNFSAVGSTSLGSVGAGSRRNYDIYRGALNLSTALTRFMNVGVSYSYFNYSFEEGVVLDPGLPRDINRQSIRAHVSLWAPIVNRSRRSNATR
jgi:hypothetical protein